MTTEWVQRELPPREGTGSMGRITGVGYPVIENASLILPCDSLSSYVASQSLETEELFPRWGYAPLYSKLSSEGGTIFSDTLLGIRYLVINGTALEHRGLKLLASDGSYRLYENPWYFGMGIMLPQHADLDMRGLQSLNVQQRGMQILLGKACEADLLVQAISSAVETGRWTYLFQGGDRHAYTYEGCIYTSIKGHDVAYPSLHLLPAERQVQVEARLENAAEELKLLSIPESALVALKTYAKELPVAVNYAGRHMDIACTSTPERNMLFLPFFWSEGYTARDEQGRPMEVCNNGGFVSLVFPEAGEHNVRLTWHRPRAALAWCLTGVGLLATLLMFRFGSTSLLPGCWFDTLCRRGLQLGTVVIFITPFVACLVAKAVLFWI